MFSFSLVAMQRDRAYVVVVPKFCDYGPCNLFTAETPKIEFLPCRESDLTLVYFTSHETANHCKYARIIQHAFFGLLT